MSETPIKCEDVGDALRSSRDLRPALAYRILFAQDHLRFRPIEVEDPVPLGRQCCVSLHPAADVASSAASLAPSA